MAYLAAVIWSLLSFFTPSSGALTNAVVPPPSGTYHVTHTTNVPYGPLSAETLNVCSPVGVKGPVPAFIIIHGGGWQQGDKSDTLETSVCTTIASKGYVAFNIDYRLVQNPANGNVPSASESDIWPDQIIDAQLAVRWVRAHAAQYNVDPNTICAWGQSAGAQLAVYLGVLAQNYGTTTLYPNYSPQVQCVEDNSGPVELTYVITGPQNGDNYSGEKDLVNSTKYAALKAASPIFDVNSNSAPMYITEGRQDTTVEPQNATDLQNALNAANVQNTLIWYNGGHVFQGLPLSQESTIIQEGIDWDIEHAKTL